MKQFEVGKVYQCRSLCNQDCIWSYTVIERTVATVTLRDNHSGKVQKNRISVSTSKYFDAETVYPLGRFSMCPSLTAY